MRFCAKIKGSQRYVRVKVIDKMTDISQCKFSNRRTGSTMQLGSVDAWRRQAPFCHNFSSTENTRREEMTHVHLIEKKSCDWSRFHVLIACFFSFCGWIPFRRRSNGNRVTDKSMVKVFVRCIEGAFENSRSEQIPGRFRSVQTRSSGNFSSIVE